MLRNLSTQSKVIYNDTVARDPKEMYESFKGFFYSVFTIPTEELIPDSFDHLGILTNTNFSP